MSVGRVASVRCTQGVDDSAAVAQQLESLGVLVRLTIENQLSKGIMLRSGRLLFHSGGFLMITLWSCPTNEILKVV